MQGLTWASIAKNPALIPLFACAVVGSIGAVGYLIRLGTKNPDVTWNNKKKPVPQDDYRDKQYKLYSGIDFDKIDKVKIPEY